LGFSKVRPSTDIPAARPLPDRTPVGETDPSARTCQVPSSFRPCRSSRLRRLAPRDGLQVCCALQPVMGFATFQGGASLWLAASDEDPDAQCHHRVSSPRCRSVKDRATAMDSPVRAIGPPDRWSARRWWVTPPASRSIDTRACDEAADANIDHPRTRCLHLDLAWGPRQLHERVATLAHPSQTRATAGQRVELNARLRASPCGASPSGGFPSSAAVPRHRGPYPLAVQEVPLARRVTATNTKEPPSTSRSCSTAESVATSGVAT
jgi:hypothetical protein